MAPVKIGINGFGRIGRLVARAALAQPDLVEIVAVNDPFLDTHYASYQFQYDTTHGKYPTEVKYDKENIIIDGKKIRVFNEKDPENIQWGSLGVEYVCESTGIFLDEKGASKHLTGKSPAKKVVISAPAKDATPMFVMGVNENKFTKDMKIVSNASCTTNCLAPMAKVLHEAFGIEKGLMTTCHAYTNDQRVADQIHTDPYRARAAAINIIPSSTGAAKAVGEVIPELNGKLTGYSLRVPVPAGSITDLTSVLKRDVTKDEVNAAIKAAADGPMRGVLEYATDPLVSSDIIGNPHSSIFMSDWTNVIGGNMVKTISWYDNEWGYSCRTAELISKVAVLG